MNFAARGLVVSLAFFSVLYSFLSVVIMLLWRALDRRQSVTVSPNFLFGLRLFPFAASLAVTVFLTFPSFWLMERASLDEDSETFLLALCGMLMLAAGVYRVLRAQARTWQAVAHWESQPANDNVAPPLLLVGVLQPRLLISSNAVSALTRDELKVAVRHELGHKSAKDNLKKVLVSSTPFPGMNRLEQAWLEASELAADDAAVTNRSEALDLAAALIKLSRCPAEHSESILATALMSGSASIDIRVKRLLAWRVDTRRLQLSWPVTLAVLLTIAVAIGGNYGATLAITHRLTELLVP